ncbi:hypothetical protein FRB95_012909 [Tulasnella sp. JGI-2019a]|nr:hypothetical protein FRB95_012909 [Tulasnella sp. JGI-2019a]
MLSESSTGNVPRPHHSSRAESKPTPASPSVRTRAARRGRGHGTGSASNIIGNTSTSTVQQAALRRDVRAAPTIQSTTNIRSQLESRPSRAVATPAPAPAPAVRSTTAEPAAPASGEAMVTYRLPVTLPRPIDMPMVTNEMLIALDPDLNGVALPFVKDALQNRREAMLRGIASVDTTNMVIPPSPTDLKVHMLSNYPNQFVVYPTHLICVSALNGTGGGVVYPINALVLVAHCARLPSFPPSASLQPDVSNHLLMPVVPIRLPHPPSFAKLFDYLYTKNFGRLCAALCPIPSESLAAITDATNNAQPRQRGELLTKIVDTIRETYEVAALLEKMKFIHGLWSNVCELGIAEEGIWKCMNLAWQVLMRALSSKPRVETSRAF